MTLFMVNCRKDLFYLPFAKPARILITCAMRMSIRFSFWFFRHHRVNMGGAALMSIVRGDTLIGNVVSQINVSCVGILIFETKQYEVRSTILS